MNWDTVKGDWKQIRGKVKEAWGKLTDDELDVVAGKRDQLVGLIQKSYGVARDEAERQVEQFERSYADAYARTQARADNSASQRAGRAVEAFSVVSDNATGGGMTCGITLPCASSGGFRRFDR